MAATTPVKQPYVARAFTPAHPDLAMGAGVPVQLGYEKYVESLARHASPREHREGEVT